MAFKVKSEMLLDLIFKSKSNLKLLIDMKLNSLLNMSCREGHMLPQSDIKANHFSTMRILLDNEDIILNYIFKRI